MAAKKIGVPYDFQKNELQNVVAQNLGSGPGSPVPGQFYYDTSSGRFIFRGAAAWVDPTERVNHSGSQLAATISDFNTATRLNRLDQMAVPTAAVALNAQKITGMADGTVSTDGATYGQLTTLLAAAANVSVMKGAVRAVVATNVNLASPGATLDGLTAANGDIFWLAAQTTGSQNGPYVFNGASSLMTRALNWDSSGEAVIGSYWVVQAGTKADQFALLSNDTFTLGTTTGALVYTSAGTAYTAGSGLTLTGSAFAIDTAVVTRKYAATIGDGSSTSLAVTHGLGTQDITYSIRDATTNAMVDCDVVATSTSVATFNFAGTAPATNSLKVVVHG